MKCPTCRSEQNIRLGTLGRLTWYRCQDCGWTFYRSADGFGRKTAQAARQIRRPRTYHAG